MASHLCSLIMFLTYDSEKLDEFSGKLQRLDSQRFF